MQPPAPTSPQDGAQPNAVEVNGEAEIGDLFTSRADAYDYLYASRTDPALLPRLPGDFVVYRFTGSHLAQPVILTQRVMERRGSMLIVDQVIDDGGEPLHLRLRLRDGSAQHNEIVSVARIANGVQLPFGTVTYESLMDEVLPPVERTEQLLGSARSSIDVNGSVIECQQTAYRVSVGGQPAYMTVMQSPSFVWGDLGGEIRDGHGELIYKAELILVSESLPTAASLPAAVAQAEPDLYDEIDQRSQAGQDGRIELSPPGISAWVASQQDLEPYDDWDELR